MAYKIETIPTIGRVRLNLDLIPNPRIGGGDILANVTLTKESDKTGIDGQMIIFTLGNVTYNIDDTKDDGKASYNFADLGSGTHAIYARLSGYPALEVKGIVNFPFMRIRVPTKFKVTAKPERETTDYEVIIELGDENGGIRDFPIVILDMDKPLDSDPSNTDLDKNKKKFEVITNSAGVFIYPVHTDRPRNIFVTAVGTEHETDKIRLPGPRRKDLLAPPPRPEPQISDLYGSVKEIAKNAHKAFKDFFNKKRRGMLNQDIINSRPGDYDLPFIRKSWFNLIVNLHYDNYRWKILFYFVCLLGISSFLLTPFIFTVPRDNTSSYLQKADEEFYKDIIDYKEISGGKSVIKTFALKFLYKSAIMSYSAFTFFAFVLFVYTFFAFGDDFMRALETARVKMYDKYGAELTSKAGVFTKMMTGQQQPQQQAIYTAGTGQPIQGGLVQQMPMQGYAPITRRYYLFWEMLISVFSEFFAKIFIR